MLKIRTAIANNLPIGFEECIRYGMIGWSFRKRFIMRDITAMQSCMNGSRMLGRKFVEETRHWDVVLRFKKSEDVPLKLISQFANRMTPEK